VNEVARAWFARNTSQSTDWQLERLIAARLSSGATVSVVIPARNKEATIGWVVALIRAVLMDEAGPVDELVVMDSLSSDATVSVATRAGARVHSVADVRPDLGVRAGKGEALWKSQFVTSGDILVFIDADLTSWGPHFVSSLIGPLLEDERIQLVRGFYDRMLDTGGRRTEEGCRVTELVARPLLAAHWPQLAAIVQPLAGQWSIRRSLFETLPVPVGYGAELSALLDTAARHGIDAIAQVDLGERGHRHQSVHDLEAMALELLSVADVRRGGPCEPAGDEVVLAQFHRDRVDVWVECCVETLERPPAASLAMACP
jgi:glucosyl-3-phosphoglycerate synthase